MSSERTDLLPTRESLVSRLHNLDDQDSWREFFNLYWKLIFRLCLRRGLSEQEAEEATQETVIAVTKTMPGFDYQPERCSFKGWLCHLADRKIVDQFRKRQRAQRHVSLDTPDTDGDTAPGPVAPDPRSTEPDAVWEAEWQQHLLELGLERVKLEVSPAQFRMFHCVAVQHQPVSQVARTLDVSVASIYLARHRVGARLKKVIRRLEEELNRPVVRPPGRS